MRRSASIQTWFPGPLAFVWYRAAILHDVPDLPPHRELRRVADDLPRDDGAARVEADEAEHDPQQRRLAAPAVADDRHALPARDLERDGPEDAAAFVRLLGALDRDHGPLATRSSARRASTAKA